MLLVDGYGQIAEPKSPQMKAKRKRHAAGFKARVTLETIKGIKTIQQIVKDYQVHPVQVSGWKKTMTDHAVQTLDGARSSGPRGDLEKERSELHAKIGQLTLEKDFLLKKSKQLGL